MLSTSGHTRTLPQHCSVSLRTTGRKIPALLKPDSLSSRTLNGTTIEDQSPNFATTRTPKEPELGKEAIARLPDLGLGLAIRATATPAIAKVAVVEAGFKVVAVVVEAASGEVEDVGVVAVEEVVKMVQQHHQTNRNPQLHQLQLQHLLVTKRKVEYDGIETHNSLGCIGSFSF